MFDHTTVDTEALARLLRTVLEHVTEMTVAFFASDFDARSIGKRVVGEANDIIVLVLRFVERRPSGAAVELGFRAEEFSATSDADVRARLVELVVLAGTSVFGSAVAELEQERRCPLHPTPRRCCASGRRTSSLIIHQNDHRRAAGSILQHSGSSVNVISRSLPLCRGHLGSETTPGKGQGRIMDRSKKGSVCLFNLLV